jgi:hypothetical protein
MTRQGREGWLRAQVSGSISAAPRTRGPMPRSRPERLREAKRRLEEELEIDRNANAQYEAYRQRGVMKNGRRFGRPPNPREPPTVPEGKVNLTDTDSKLVHGIRGWIQGYNAQAACNEQHVIVAAEVMTASPDFGHLGPMVSVARTELTAAGVTAIRDVIVADAGYWHLEQMNEITGRGIPVLIPPDSSRRTNTRPGWNGGAYDFMRSVLRTEHGSELYKQRGAANRADLWPHQTQPRLQPLPPPRPSRRPDRMAADGDHAEPGQAPPALHRPRRVTARASPPSPRGPASLTAARTPGRRSRLRDSLA